LSRAETASFVARPDPPALCAGVLRKSCARGGGAMLRRRSSRDKAIKRR